MCHPDTEVIPGGKRSSIVRLIRTSGFPCRRFLVCFVIWQSLASSQAAQPFLFRDVTAQSGITFRHTDGSSGRRYIVETVSAGLALFDYDMDGDVDIYFLNGSPPPGAKVDSVPRNALWRNDGDWHFTDVTDLAGVGHAGHGLGVAVGDYDNDGDPDLFLNNFGPNVLYRNNGDGTFSDVTDRAQLAGGASVGAGACFLDIDADGDLDLYAANYLEFSFEEHVSITTRGVPVYASPSCYRPAADVLYRNDGDGLFTDVSKSSGVAGRVGWGMGVVSADFDADGDTDIFVANDVAENFLWENDGAGRFKEVGLMAGVAYDFSGNAQGSMGVDCADFDNDGMLDFHVTSYQRQLATLYRNLGNGFFEDVTIPSGAGEGTLSQVTWGSALVDLDNDGDRDLFIACGHLQDTVQRYDDTLSYHTRNMVLANDGQGGFSNLSEQCGDGLEVKLSSRGAAFDDLDNDGDLDVVILNSRRRATLLRNDGPSENHWLQIRLRGTTTNADGLGARVIVTAGDLTQIDEVHGGRGYQSHWGSLLHFGLGARDHVDRIEVRWLGGGIDVFENLDANQRITLSEGEGD